MKTTKHWHVVEEEGWDNGTFRRTTTWNPIQLSEQESRELEQMRAQQRLLQAAQTIADSAKQIGFVPDAQTLQLIQRKLSRW